MLFRILALASSLRFIISIALILFVSFSSIESAAQLPTYVRDAGPSKSTSFGWGGGTSCRKVQMLYFPSDFSPAVSNGIISELFFMYGSTTGATVNTDYVNLCVKLGQTTNTGFSPATSFYLNLSPVLTEASYTIQAGKAGDWFSVILTTPFPYDKTQTLIVEISFDSCINAVNSGGLGCYSGTPIADKKLKSPIPTSITGSKVSEVLNMGLKFGGVTCSGVPVAGGTIAAATTLSCGASTVLSLSNNTLANGISYQWQYKTNGAWTDFGTSSATQNTPSLTENMQFRCVVTCSGNGTSISDPISISVAPIRVNLGKDTFICPGDVQTLNAGNNGGGYLWNTGSTAQSIIVNVAGTYSVAVSMPDGCYNTDTIVITNGNIPVAVLPALTDLCYGDTASLNAGNQGSSFLWENGSTAQILKVTDGGTYIVKVKSTDGCIVNSSTKVTMRPLPLPALSNDTGICEGDSLTLKAGNPDCVFLWNTQDTSGNIKITDSGTYAVTITTPYGCKLKEDVHVSFLPEPYADGFKTTLLDQSIGKFLFEAKTPEHFSRLEWNFGDATPKSTELKPEHTYVLSGDYMVRLTLFNDCGQYNDSLLLKVEVPNGIPTLKNGNNELVVYPNPSHSYVIVENRSTDLKMEQISIFNAIGMLVSSSVVDKSTKHKLNVNEWASGIYSLRILTNKGWIVQKLEILK